MASTPWAKFYWSDWASDPALRLCSLAAQGLWMRMLCVAAESDPIGFVTVNSRGLNSDDLARLTGVGSQEVNSLLSELDRNGVFSRDAKGRMFSRRMVRDAKRAAILRKNGQKGGNPSLTKQREIPSLDKPPDIHGDKPQIPEARYQNNTSPKPNGFRDSPPRAELDAMLDAYNDVARSCGLPIAAKMSKGRAAKAKARLQEFGLDGWATALDKLRAATWMHGDNDRKWRADFDFLLQPASLTRLIEGSYDRTQVQCDVIKLPERDAPRGPPPALGGSGLQPESSVGT